MSIFSGSGSAVLVPIGGQIAVHLLGGGIQLLAGSLGPGVQHRIAARAGGLGSVDLLLDLGLGRLGIRLRLLLLQLLLDHLNLVFE